MEKLIFSLTLIISGLALGYAIQSLTQRGIITLPLSIGDLRKILQKIVLLALMPISFLAAVWTVSFDNIRIAFMPFIGAVILIAGGILGLVYAKIMRRPDKQTGVLFCCGSFTNIGAIGGLVCFIFFGETGFGLIVLYKMFEEIIYYSIGFPIARYFSGQFSGGVSALKRIAQVIGDPFVFTAFGSFLIGLTLNLLHVPRPQELQMLTAVFVPVGTFILIITIGMGMRFSRTTSYVTDCIGISVIKFFIIPLFGFLLASMAGLQHIDGGLPFKVVVLLSSMPVAFNAIVASSIYELDLDLANSCWLITTAALIVIIPVYYFLFLH